VVVLTWSGCFVRDFANGFLVAEILSRYFDRDIQMHSYDNGTAIRVRKDNWDQLSKFFRRQGIMQDAAQPEDIDAIIHCENGAVVSFLNALYELLTKRTVQEVTKRYTDDDQPPFSKPTASQVMHQSMKTSEMQENDDEDTRERYLRESIASHNNNLQSDRNTDPDRFSSITKTPSKILRGPTRTVGSEEGTASRITVKDVNVKKIKNKDLAALRAEKAGASNPGASSMQRGGMQPSMTAMNQNSGMAMTGMDYTPVTDILDACVVNCIQPLPQSFEKTPISSFVDNITSRIEQQIPDEVAGAVFQETSMKADDLANSSLSAPKEFWKVASVYCTVLSDAEEASGVFASATQAFVELGRSMVAKDAGATASLFGDFALTKLSQMLGSNPGKRHAILRVIYAFCQQDVTTHIQMIKLLQERVPEMGTFVHALTILIFMERQMNDALLDLYLYYCVIGVSMPSPSLRAASVAMLAVVIAHNVDLVVDMLPRLQVMAAEETWWEVHAQLLVVCSALLRQLPENSEHTAGVMSIVSEVFYDGASLIIRKIGLSYLAKNMGVHQKLLPLYLSVLSSMPVPVDSMNAFLLSTDKKDSEELPVAGASGGKYRLQPLPCSREWPGLLIAQQLVTDLQSNQPEHMETEQMQAFLACLTSAEEGAPFQDNMTQWVDVFSGVRDYVFVALCDGECCDLALSVLRKFILESSLQDSVLREGTLLGSLRLLYPMDGSADAECQAMVTDFFRQIWEAGDPYADAVEALLEQFARNHGDQFQASPLSALRDSLGQ
jgi:hypothetical protein